MGQDRQFGFTVPRDLTVLEHATYSPHDVPVWEGPTGHHVIACGRCGCEGTPCTDECQEHQASDTPSELLTRVAIAAMDHADGTGFVIKDSGKREDFGTGSVRDTEDGKVDWTLLPTIAMARFVRHLMRGAKKYGRHNWTKGQSMARAERSLCRHLVAYMEGERTEDHLAAIVFNASVLMDHEERIKTGALPAHLDDRDPR